MPPNQFYKKLDQLLKYDDLLCRQNHGTFQIDIDTPVVPFRPGGTWTERSNV